MLRLSLFILACTLQFTTLAQTTVEKIDSAWVLKVDGEPFPVKGATFGYEADTANYDRYFTDLQFLGVNTIRTWGVNEYTGALLDAAHAHGMKVMVGIWMRHGRPGMEADDSFNYLTDEAGKTQMYRDAVRAVAVYRDHPAVLTWGIGNEVYLNMATDEEKRAYSLLLEKICSKIKSLDPNHPITSVEAWTFGMDWWSELVPSLDIYGLNAYGPGAGLLADELAERQLDKPYMITEFGVTGEWDIQDTLHGVKIEPTDQQKYDAIAQGYPNWIKSKPACLGVYVFHYSDGDDFVSPWLLMHHRGYRRPQYWATREAYTGAAPLNKLPVIDTFALSVAEAQSGSWLPVHLAITEPESEELDLSFYYNQRSGSRKRRGQLVPLASRGNLADGFELQLPPEHGPVKIYVNAVDSYGNVGIASTAIRVVDETARQRKYLVPRATLPFYVYQDGKESAYIPSAHMGNFENMAVDLQYTTEAHTGEACLQLSYQAAHNWYGLGLVDPPNDWGEMLGGFDLSGATTFSFWARASQNKVDAKIGFGLIADDKPYPDTAIKSLEVRLTKRWQQFTIPLDGLDLSCIRSGLVLFSNGVGQPYEIYLDEVRFE